VEGITMKTNMIKQLSLLILMGIFPVYTSLNIKGQDDIYYSPSKNEAVSKPTSNASIKDTAGMSAYEKYRAMRDVEINSKNSKPDSITSNETSQKSKNNVGQSKKKVAIDSSSVVNETQEYNEQPEDNDQQGAVVNNYYSDDGFYYDRFRRYHSFYFDNYFDPFFDPFCWDFGFGWGMPYWGFGFGWGYPYSWYSPYGYYGYKPAYWYQPSYYRNYGNNGGYLHPAGGARRTLGSYGTPSSFRNAGVNYGNRNIYSGSSFGRRVVSAAPNTNITNYGINRRSAVMTTNQNPTNTNGTVRRNVINSGSDRLKTIPTTRLPVNESRRNISSGNYSPSYSSRTSTKPSYNTPNNSYSGGRRSSSVGSQNATTYSRPTSNTFRSGSSGSVSPRRSSERMSAPSNVSRGGSSNSGRSSGSTGSSGHSSGSSSSHSSGGGSSHSSSGGGGHGGRR